MESHCSQRRGKSIWSLHENCVIKPLIDVGMIREQDTDLIQRYCGILDVNTFEVRTESFEVYATIVFSFQFSLQTFSPSRTYRFVDSIQEQHCYLMIVFLIHLLLLIRHGQFEFIVA